VFYYFLSPYGKSEIRKRVYQVAAAGIKGSELIKIPIPIPPLSLQQSFVEKIEAIEQQKARISQSIAETQRLFDYTMDKYFG
jgi:type I restriction enzyme S subunit